MNDLTQIFMISYINDFLVIVFLNYVLKYNRNLVFKLCYEAKIFLMRKLF